MFVQTRKMKKVSLDDIFCLFFRENKISATTNFREKGEKRRYYLFNGERYVKSELMQSSEFISFVDGYVQKNRGNVDNLVVSFLENDSIILGMILSTYYKTNSEEERLAQTLRLVDDKIRHQYQLGENCS